VLYAEVLDRLAERRQAQAAPLVVGLSGAQGTGKTTLAAAWAEALAARGLRTAQLSLDDLYLPYAERQARRAADPGNPYYAIPRGNPGTHDVELGVATVRALRAATETSSTPLPAFDKSLRDGAGDRLPREQWPLYEGRPDFILLEGWLVGAPSLPEDRFAQLLAAAPAEARAGDPDGAFARQLNRALAAYEPLFSLLDFLLYLKPPSIEAIFAWRRRQEEELRERTGSGLPPAAVDQLVRGFLLATAVYGLGVLGDPTSGRADAIVELAADHTPRRLFLRGGRAAV
jgi:D-glycerate 3-kinase